jgi:hypothetical protein
MAELGGSDCAATWAGSRGPRIAPTIWTPPASSPTQPHGGHSLLSSYGGQHPLTKWWKQGDGTAGPITWVSYVSTREQYTESCDIHTDDHGTPGGFRGCAVP